MSERYSRQEDIVPLEKINKVTVIGIGAIGRQVALQLAAMGVSLQLIDFDIVEESNLASQGYLEENLNELKTVATNKLCQNINSGISIGLVNGRFCKNTPDIGKAVFVCVDKIKTRGFIWKALENKTDFIVDGRMTAESVRIITAYDYESKKHYPTTLFSSEEAFVGACTAKTTIYCANIAAGFMITQFTKYLRNMPIDYDIQLNLLASELSISSE